ncbi:MAG: ferredoxin family protein [Leptospirales bacterium]|jgi:NAD-dependent dihydropyrimidine dehydrogenase PreA subunit
MPYTIVEPCVGVCDTACVEVCPVDCIHPTKEEWSDKGFEEGKLEGKQLFIDPEECIDCGACEPVCPVQAIFAEDEVPDKWKDFIAKNYEYYGQTFNG